MLLAVALAVTLLVADASSVMGAGPVRGIAETTLSALAPEGYKAAKHIPWKAGAADVRIVAFSDAAVSDDDIGELPTRPVVLGLLVWNGKWTLRDKVLPHYNTGTSDEQWPNYFTDLDQVEVGNRKLILLRTTVFGGGSGSLQYFDFYDIDGEKLSLVKSFAHGRFESYYFALHEKNVYDADLVCRRGERHGKSFVYTCYLQVTRYGFDGRSLVETGSEKLQERKGNRFLGESYRFMSVKRALDKGEIFARR
jgi:hypothetical protein